MSRKIMPDGRVIRAAETYRVANNRRIINRPAQGNQPGYIVNANYAANGPAMTITSVAFNANLPRVDRVLVQAPLQRLALVMLPDPSLPNPWLPNSSFGNWRSPNGLVPRRTDLALPPRTGMMTSCRFVQWPSVFRRAKMFHPALRRAVSCFLLGVPLLLWLLIALFWFRVVNIFDARLMKFPGPWVVFGAMIVLPIAAVVLGITMLRSGRARLSGAIAVSLGTLLCMAFVVLIGRPMVLKAMEPGTPKNPSAPRPFVPLQGLAVFPGAQGFGTDTPAGRGGKVIEVTTLADDGPGSLRAALDDADPRIVVFRVAGTIELKEQLFINRPFVTVAGQTAPGGGICLKNAGIAITTHDVLIQHLRIRPGNEGSIEPDDNDAVQILGKHGRVEGAHHVVLDHISTSWSEDETISTWYGAHDVTICWSIISEALDRSRHRKGHHSAGLLIGDSSCNVSVHHCLLAHNGFRNPLISKGGTHDFVNNVVYDWGVLCSEVWDSDSNSFLNFVGNYYLPGPSSECPHEILIDEEPGTPRLYVEGNVSPRQAEAADNWSIVKRGWGPEPRASEAYRSPSRFEVPPVTTSSAAETYEKVLASVGAMRPMRDPVDTRIVSDVKGRTGKIIDTPAEVGGYPALAAGAPPADSDHDGMPDAWEREHGLNASDPSDANGDLDGDTYTNVEEYLHSLL